MTTSKYRVAINGFWCHNETWDDVFNWDGKHDEDSNASWVPVRTSGCHQGTESPPRPLLRRP
jgi:hypothetical protein